jgi:hypothetical protein
MMTTQVSAVRVTFLSVWFLFAAAAATITPPAAHAQDDCEKSLKVARREYNFGLFDKVLAEAAKAKACSTEQLLQIYELKGLAFMALDQPKVAKTEIVRILELDPLYQPDESRYAARYPELFRAYVDEVRDAIDKQKLQETSGGKTWRWLAGGVSLVVAGVTAALLLSGGKDELPGPPGPPGGN